MPASPLQAHRCSNTPAQGVLLSETKQLCCSIPCHLRTSPGLPSHRTSKSCPFPSFQGPRRVECLRSQSLIQVPATAHSSTPGDHSEGLKPWRGRAGTAAHSSTPRTGCLSSGDGASFQGHQPTHKHSPDMASEGSQARSGALEHNSHVQPCQGCARCQGKRRTAQEQPNLGFYTKLFMGFSP